MTDTEFPLAEGIYAKIADDIHALVNDGAGMFVTETTSTTSTLLRFWFDQNYCDVRELNFHVGQRDAILAIVYAHEILGATNLGELYREVAAHALVTGDVFAEVGDSRNQHPKYAAKMATGTGKTWVLNALLIWQYLNAIAEPNDTRFTKNFLVVAPGLIVYDRLLDSFQGRMVDGNRDPSTSDIASCKDLFVPENYRQTVFGFLQGSVVTKHDIGRKVTGSGVIAIANWHLLTGADDEAFAEDDDTEVILSAGEEIDHRALVDDLLPLTPGVTAGNSLETLDRRARRGESLDYLVDLPSLMVFNDEAHHIHAVKRGEEVTEVEWQKSLRRIASGKGSRFVQVDFSATPYNEVSAGRAGKKKRFFPHIVVNFDLPMAMSQGLVKTLVLDRRQEIAALPLNFSVDRDDAGNPSLSDGQQRMLRAGLVRLKELASSFEDVDPSKHPKMLVVCEDTTVVPLVEEFLQTEGVPEEDVLSVHSGKKAELGEKEWKPVREKLFGLDRHSTPKVIISVLMLREGFDVNNICVIVPLRATEASILLEQTVGRGLRLMWRGDSAIDDIKAENRRLLRAKQKPTSYYDMLFVVEHPKFNDFYNDLMHGGDAFVLDDTTTTTTRGDIETLQLRPGYEQYDFTIPFVIRDPEEELREPTLDPMALAVSKFELEFLKAAVGRGEVFTGYALQHGVQFGDYRVDGGVMTATGYNDYLARLANRIVTAHHRAFANTTQGLNAAARFPILHSYQRLVIGWLNRYIRDRYFGETFDPFHDENWRVLLVDQVPQQIAGEFGRALVELNENIPAGGAEVLYRYTSEVAQIRVRSTHAVAVTKCIFEKQPYPSQGGGLERDFLGWVDRDAKVEALLKIDEHKHDFLRRPYLKADGMPAQYSPDFLVRSAEYVFVVETKGQSSLTDANVQRKRKAALAWVNGINALEPKLRENRTWHYVLAGETAIRNHIDGGGTALEFLKTSALFDANGASGGDQLFV
jgi:type III restriction enzyme